MNYCLKSVAFLILIICNAVENASILALFSTLSFSDHLVFRGYIRLLAEVGHSIVIMTPYPGHLGIPETEGVVELGVGADSAMFWDEYKSLVTDADDYLPRMRAYNELSVKIAVAQLKSKPMSSLLMNPNVKFDLVITEADIPLFYAVAEKYQAPHIAITTSSGLIHQYESKGAPIHPIMYPDVNVLNHQNASQWQIMVEINRHVDTQNEYYDHYLPLCEVAAKKLFGLKKRLLELERDIDMLFIASNPILIGNRPSVPAITYVDRMHIRPGFHLPDDLRDLLDSATKGVIYFSFGAIQEPEHLSIPILQTLADAFSDLSYMVLWKISNTSMINMPNNVITSTWFPQQEVLAHPNVKAFITHGGARSLEEALFYEVPIIGLPMATSRKVFIEQITKHGAGEILDMHYLEKNNVKEIITAVVSDDRYKYATVQLRNKVFDPIISGPENALRWTQYVLRHRGARHLRSPAVGTTFTKYYSLDIITVLLSVSIMFSTFILFTLCYLIKYIRACIWEKYNSRKFKAV